MKRLFMVFSLVMSCVLLLSGCVNKPQPKSDESESRKNIATATKDAKELLKVIQPQIKNGMTSQDLTRIIVKAKVPEIHELSKEEINTFFEMLPKEEQQEYYKKWEKHLVKVTPALKLDKIEDKVIQVYGDKYMYISDVEMEGNNKEILKCRIGMHDGGDLIITDYKSQQYTKEHQVPHLPGNRKSRFALEYLATKVIPEGDASVQYWTFQFIFTDVDLSEVQ